MQDSPQPGRRPWYARLEPCSAIDVVAISCVLAAMVMANLEWLFTRQGWIDSWMYFGFFRHYGDPSFLDGNKKIARLPWILLGYFVNKLASPEIASLCLHLGLFALGAIAFYRLALKRFGRLPAFIATLTYVTWIPLAGSGGWDYHNTLTPVLYFAAYSSLITAASAPHRPFRKFFRVGILFAIVLHVNILVVLLLPGLAFQITHRVREWCISGTKDIRSWLAGASAGVLAGAIAVTVILGLINLAVGRGLFFFVPLISRSVTLLANPVLEKTWWLPWSNNWWIASFHTGMLDAVLILTLVRLGLDARPLRALIGSDVACAMLEFVISVGMYAIGQSLGHPLLEPYYMAMPLAMPMFFALSALISATGNRITALPNIELSNRASNFLVTFCVVAVGIQFVGDFSMPAKLFAGLEPSGWLNVPAILIVLSGFSVAEIISRLPFLRTFRLDHRILPWAFLAIALGQANAFSPIGRDDDRTPYDYRQSCTARRSILSDIAAADDALFPFIRAGKRVIIWSKSGEEEGLSPLCRIDPSNDIAAPLIAMGYSTLEPYWIMEKMPTMPQRDLKKLHVGADVLAVITNDQLFVQTLQKRLAQQDAEWRITDSRVLGNYDLKVRLSLVTSKADLSAAEHLSLDPVPYNGAILKKLSEGRVGISLPSTPWTYSASLLPARGIPTKTGTLIVTVRVVSGSVGIGVVNPSGSKFLTREMLSAGSGNTSVELKLTDWSEAGSLMIESGAKGGGEIIVSSIAFVASSASSTAIPP